MGRQSTKKVSEQGELTKYKLISRDEYGNAQAEKATPKPSAKHVGMLMPPLVGYGNACLY